VDAFLRVSLKKAEPSDFPACAGEGAGVHSERLFYCQPAQELSSGRHLLACPSGENRPSTLLTFLKLDVF